MIRKLFQEILNTKKYHQNNKNVFQSQEHLFSIDEKYALAMPYFLLKSNIRYNAYKRFIWLLENQSEYFYTNIDKMVQYGSYKALWDFLSICDTHNINVDKEKFYEVIKNDYQKC